MLIQKLTGAFIGLVIGIVVISAGVWEAFILALFILGGWLVTKFWMGEIDLLDSYERFLESKGKRYRR